MKGKSMSKVFRTISIIAFLLFFLFISGLGNEATFVANSVGSIVSGCVAFFFWELSEVFY